jgi:HTH-like domain
VRYAFIQRHRRVWPISVQCRVLGVSVSGYHEHFVRRASDAQRRHLSDDALLVHIKAIHAETRGGYGWPRIWKELLARGIRVGKQRVQKLMQLHGIRAKGKRRFKVTTDSNHDLPISPNLLNREFILAEPDKVWAGDISAPCRRGLQQGERRDRRSANRSWLILDRQLKCCLAPVEAGRKGAAKLGRLPTAGCHAQSSLNCTEQGRLRPVRRATARSMVRQRSVRWKPLYLPHHPARVAGSCGVIRLGLMFPSGGCALPHSTMDFLPQPSSGATRGRARHLRT